MAIEKRTRTRVEVEETEETVTRKEVVEREEEIEVPVCDFCEQAYPGEEPDYLTPVMLNPRVEVERTRTDIVTVPNDHHFNSSNELHRALRESRLIEFNRKPVMTSELTADFEEFNADSVISANTSISKNEIAYEFSVNRPTPEVKDDGKMMVCEFCTEMFEDD